jgi:hypothetical protein
VTVERGPNERREPIFLKERTEREGKHEGGGGTQQEHTPTTRVSEEGGRETEARWGVHGGGSRSTCAKRVQNARKKKQIHIVRKVPKYKRATNAQVIAAPEAKDPGTVFGSKLWPRPGGEPENRLVAPKDRYTELHAQSLEGTCNPFVRVRGHVQAMGGLSSSLSEGGGGGSPRS